jgi:hypothetical protein
MDKKINVEQIRIDTEQMKQIMKNHIDSICEDDMVNFDVSFVKVPREKDFVKSVTINIEKDVEECDCPDCRRERGEE